MVSLRRPPTFMPTTPSSQPWITCPPPSANENGWPWSFEESRSYICSLAINDPSQLALRLRGRRRVLVRKRRLAGREAVHLHHVLAPDAHRRPGLSLRKRPHRVRVEEIEPPDLDDDVARLAGAAGA